MAGTKARTATEKKSGSSTNTANSSPQIKSGEAAVPETQIPVLEPELMKVLQEQLGKVNGDPSKVRQAFCNFVSIAIARDMGPIALSMIATAKKGNASAVKVLVNLCEIASEAVNHEVNSSEGIVFTDALGPVFDPEELLQSQEQLAGKTAEAAADGSFCELMPV